MLNRSRGIAILSMLHYFFSTSELLRTNAVYSIRAQNHLRKGTVHIRVAISYGWMPFLLSLRLASLLTQSSVLCISIQPPSHLNESPFPLSNPLGSPLSAKFSSLSPDSPFLTQCTLLSLILYLCRSPSLISFPVPFSSSGSLLLFIYYSIVPSLDHSDPFNFNFSV